MDQCKEIGNVKVDPDYESYNSALELNEEEDKKENLIKIRKIIEGEYNREIMQRQEQIEQIELQICKVRKLLHLLRYALIMSYYKKKELEYSGTEDEPSTSDSLTVPDKQSRIHPAIKKLLGKNIQSLDHLNIRDKRKSNARNTSDSKSTEYNEITPESKKIKLDLEISHPVNEAIPDIPNNKNQDTNLEFIRQRKKTKYRIVVGNISKWMPSSEDDILTHKWMVYVRGPKEKPDVSHFIEKVVFYLHPSYKPHDVVEVSESPYHLSRRGWGEFPVRVQIFFKITLNKPIDIIHNIKLDKTYTGRQTLGNETVIDVFLYDDNKEYFMEEETELTDKSVRECDGDTIKVEKIKIENELQNVASTSSEHDYCFGIIKTETLENNQITFDHSYCLPPSHQNMPKIKTERVEQDENNSLIYGLDKYYSDTNSELVENCSQTKKTMISLNNSSHLIQLNRKDIKFNNTKIIVFGKKIDGALLSNFNKVLCPSKISRDAKFLTNRSEQNDFKIKVPKNKFKNVGEVLPYLFKRLPLYSDLANNVYYKRTYPFTATSLKEFVSWNVGKRRSSEWSRAKTIRNILMQEKIYGMENWNTKAILMYGRSHDYTPFISYGLFSRDSEEKKLLLSCYANSSQNVKKFSVKTFPFDDSDITINVDSDIDVEKPPKKLKCPVVDITDLNSKLECSYIKQTALDCGIILKPEEIDDGVVVNGAEIMIFEAVKCLAENLIRRAKNHRVCTKISSPSTSAINKEDVEIAINERPEILAFRQIRHERRNIEYFS